MRLLVHRQLIISVHELMPLQSLHVDVDHQKAHVDNGLTLFQDQGVPIPTIFLQYGGCHV